MCDVEKILKTFEADLKSKPEKERVAYLRSFGFQVYEKKNPNKTQTKKQNKRKPVLNNV